ncbi:MAG TPA: cupin domain-containing protein [Flexilinea sp.]|jgi:quercetin dioxygenase-like cupin family protein|nr:cupin domain-containing protein [Flexilinea sp.]HOU18506.1 cupin domain-containing protein [Flexilinea sp.]HQF79244.1 cupin domain-containing protein [Flexilinea sp.]HQG87977.1 cupin domain-containing protein [Flexilinea sp.]
MAKEQYVFESEGKIIRYRFPTHINDLIIPREESTCAEVFMVVLDENEAPPLHKHDDAEQIFYMIQGKGKLEIRKQQNDEPEYFEINVGQVIKIPPHIWHRVFALSKEGVRYLSIDCFPNGFDPSEPTWDDHVKNMATANGWDFSKIREDRR